MSGMGLGMGLNLRQTQKLSPVQVLEYTVKQRIALLQTLRDETYDPKGMCPKCETRMTPAEIIHGFNRDPKDVTTKCPKCKTRFSPRLVWSGMGSRIEVGFLCPVQTLDRLKGKNVIKPAEISMNDQAVHRSAIFHFGSLKKAFKEMGIHYHYNEPMLMGWKEKIKPYLGKISDAAIARAAQTRVNDIRDMRVKLHIPRWTTALAEI